MADAPTGEHDSRGVEGDVAAAIEAQLEHVASRAGAWWSGFVQTVRARSGELLEQTKQDLSEFASMLQTDTRQSVAETAASLRAHLERVRRRLLPSPPRAPFLTAPGARRATQDRSAAGAPTAAAAASPPAPVAPTSAAPDATVAADETKRAEEDEEEEKATFGSLLSKTMSDLLGSLAARLSDTVHMGDAAVSETLARPPATRTEALMQRLRADPSTFATDPPDQAGFRAWCASVDLSEREDDMTRLLGDHPRIRDLYTAMVRAARAAAGASA